MKNTKSFAQEQKRLVNEIRYRMIISDFNIQDRATRSGVPKATLYGRMHRPDNFRFGELQQIAAAMNTTVEEITKGRD